MWKISSHIEACGVFWVIEHPFGFSDDLLLAHGHLWFYQIDHCLPPLFVFVPVWLHLGLFEHGGFEAVRELREPLFGPRSEPDVHLGFLGERGPVQAEVGEFEFDRVLLVELYV